ncbi:MAG: thioredoxin [Verrucomicrobiia bacterium]
MDNTTSTNYDVGQFEAQVIQRSKQVPVLVDFWAPWCGPCRMLGPTLERLAAEANGRWELVKLNTEENQELAAVFNIASIPAVKLFVDGKVADEFVGALPEREIRRFLEKALPSPNARELEEAERLLNEGANAAAAARLENVLRSESGTAEARLLLARALLHLAPERIAEVLAPVGPDSDLADKAKALRTLGRLAQLPGQPSGLPEAGLLRERYLAGAAAVRSGDFAAALPAFIEVLEKDRSFDDGGAKEACKSIFQLLGMQHPLVQRYFRAFSSAVHA